jgi:phenylacetate-CoA ligase
MILHESFTRRIYWPLVQKLKREYAAQALKELAELQWKSQDEILSIQWQLVRRVVNKAAQEVPYYRKAYKRIGWDFNNKEFSHEDFLNIPKIEKEEVRDHPSEFLNPNYKGRVTEGSTSGSTGQSLNIYYDGEHSSYSEACRWRAKNWWGVRLGSPHVAIWGRPYTGYKDRMAQQIKSYFMNSLLFSAFDIRQHSLKKIWKKIYRFKPHIIYGYPSAIFALAEYIKNNKLSGNKLGIKVIMITAESSSLEQRSVIEEVFGCRTANEYGCSETGGFVYECPEGNWHISSELTFIEFIGQDGRPVSPGGRGEILLTHLRNNYMPLIRYRVGDIGGPLARKCDCGRNLPLMQVAVAKESDIIRLANGEAYMSGDLLYINKAVMKVYPSSILQFRVTQKTIDLFEIEIVSGAGQLEKAEQLFAQLIRKQWGKNIQIHFTRVTSIEREPSGKLRYFISEIKKNHIS